MKNILIAGTYKTEYITTEKDGLTTTQSKIHYKVDIFGNTKEDPRIQYITSRRIVTNIGFDELIDLCKEMYCRYFAVKDNNIITMTSLSFAGQHN